LKSKEMKISSSKQLPSSHILCSFVVAISITENQPRQTMINSMVELVADQQKTTNFIDYLFLEVKPELISPVKK